mmetsp:Transcript_59564/g.128908  ORF Transcript_59564/g.128908 Transcript_59564/m.128908 type:complete len:397 (+) Transcript_59564:169-1359(+)
MSRKEAPLEAREIALPGRPPRLIWITTLTCCRCRKRGFPLWRRSHRGLRLPVFDRCATRALYDHPEENVVRPELCPRLPSQPGADRGAGRFLGNGQHGDDLRHCGHPHSAQRCLVALRLHSARRRQVLFSWRRRPPEDECLASCAVACPGAEPPLEARRHFLHVRRHGDSGNVATGHQEPCCALDDAREDFLTCVSTVAKHSSPSRSDALGVRHERRVRHDGIEGSAALWQSLIEVTLVDPPDPLGKAIQGQVELGKQQGPWIEVHEDCILRVMPERHDALNAAAAACVQQALHLLSRCGADQGQRILREIHHRLKLVRGEGLLEVGCNEQVLLHRPYGYVGEGEERSASNRIRSYSCRSLLSRDEAATIALHSGDGLQAQQGLTQLRPEDLREAR